MRKQLLTYALSFLLMLSFVAVLPPSEVHGWISGYSYRKTLTVIQDASAPEYYLIPITVHYGAGTDSNFDVYLDGNCRASCADVYFTNTDDDHLESWVFNWTTSVFATYFVPVTNLNMANQTIRMYYGNNDDNIYETYTGIFNYSLTNLNVIVPFNDGNTGYPENYGVSAAQDLEATIQYYSEGFWVDDVSPYHESAYWFNETSTNNYAYLLDVTDGYFDFDESYSGFAWVNMTSGYSNTAELFIKSGCYQFEMVSPNDWLQTFIVQGGTPYGTGYYGTDTDPDLWHLLGAGWDNDSQTLNIWRNASNIVSSGKAATGIDTADNNLLIGYRADGIVCWLIMNDTILSTTAQGWLHDTSYYPQYSDLLNNRGDLYFRPYVYPEPSLGVWGSEEAAPTPTPSPVEYATRGEFLAAAVVASLIFIPILLLIVAGVRKKR